MELTLKDTSLKIKFPVSPGSASRSWDTGEGHSNTGIRNKNTPLPSPSSLWQMLRHAVVGSTGAVSSPAQPEREMLLSGLERLMETPL